MTWACDVAAIAQSGAANLICNSRSKQLGVSAHFFSLAVLYVIVRKEAEVAFYTLEATNADGTTQMKSPLTAAQAYAKAVELRRRGFSDIVAINAMTGRRITDVQRLLRDL
jgi:hypothetical protein